MPLTEETIQDGFEFYTTFFKSPPAIKVCGNVPFAGVVCSLSLRRGIGSHARRDGYGTARISGQVAQVG